MDFDCKPCQLKFRNKIILNLHLSLIHGNILREQEQSNTNNENFNDTNSSLLLKNKIDDLQGSS